MAQYVVRGTDRMVGAIGVMQEWSETVEAEDAEAAKERARAARYAIGREHVHCYQVVHVVSR